MLMRHNLFDPCWLINLVKIRRIYNITLMHNCLPIKWKTTQLNPQQMALSFSAENI